MGCFSDTFIHSENNIEGLIDAEAEAKTTSEIWEITFVGAQNGGGPFRLSGTFLGIFQLCLMELHNRIVQKDGSTKDKAGFSTC